MTQSASPDRNTPDTAQQCPVPAPLDLAGWVVELEEFAREVSAELESIRRELGESDVSAVTAVRPAATASIPSAMPNSRRTGDSDLAARRNSMQERLKRLAGEHRPADDRTPVPDDALSIAHRSREARP